MSWQFQDLVSHWAFELWDVCKSLWPYAKPYVQRQLLLITVISRDFCLRMLLGENNVTVTKVVKLYLCYITSYIQQYELHQNLRRPSFFPFFQEMIEILPLLISENLCTTYFGVRESSKKSNFFFVMQQVRRWCALNKHRWARPGYYRQKTA